MELFSSLLSIVESPHVFLRELSFQNSNSSAETSFIFYFMNCAAHVRFVPAGYFVVGAKQLIKGWSECLLNFFKNKK